MDMVANKKSISNILLDFESLVEKCKNITHNGDQSRGCNCIIVENGEIINSFCGIKCKNAQKKVNLLVRHLTSLLSHQNQTYSNVELTDLYTKILKFVYIDNALDINSIYMSLFSFSFNLILEFCSEEATFVNNINIWAESSYMKDALHKDPCQRVLFLQALSFKHILSPLYTWLMNCHSNETTLNSLMQMSDWCSPLYLLSFLHHWSIAEDKLSLAPRLQTLLNCYSDSSDSLISTVALEKNRHMSIVQWCIECCPSLNVQKMLKLLNDHSTLYAIQACVPIQNISYHKIKEIFLKISQQDYSDSSFDTSCDYTYSGFYILLLSFNSIICGIEMDKSVSGWRVRKRNRHHICKDSDIGIQRNETDINNYKTFYKQFVCKPLERIIYIFRDIYSIAFCLEILENLFSLLFIRHTSLSDDACNSCWDGTENNSPSSLKQEMETFPSISSVMSSLDNNFQLLNPMTNISSSIISSSAIERTEFKTLNNSERLLPTSGKYLGQLKPITEKIGASEKSKNTMRSSFLLFENFTSSDLSSSSIINDFSNCGYIMNILVVWDHILLLKELICSLKERRGDYYKSKFSILLSIDETEISLRLQNLEYRVDCALWRLKILMPKYQNRTLGSENEISAYINDTLLCNFSSNVKYDKNEIGINTNPNLKKKLSVNTNNSKSETVGIIHYLLSSPENLLNISLVRDNIDGAEAVAQKFDLQSCREKQELTLLKCLKESIPKIENISSPKLENSSLQRNLDADTNEFRSDAADEISKEIQFLSSDIDISCLIDQALNLFLLENPYGAKFDNGEENIFVQLFPKLILADIALTSKITDDIALDLLNEVLSQEEVLPFNSSPPFLSLQSYFQSSSKLRNIMSLLFEVKKNDYEFCICDFFSAQKWNPASLLLSNCPLTEDAMKCMKKEWESLLKSMIDFVKNYEIQKTLITQKIGENPKLLDLYMTLQAKLENEFYQEIEKPSQDAIVSNNYFAKFIDYLTLLDTIIDQCSNITSSTTTKQKNIFLLLNERPINIFGKLLFEAKMDPVELETICKQIHFDLLTVIVKYVLPLYPIKPYKFKDSSKNHLTYENFGCQRIKNYFVLNSSGVWDPNAVHGDFTVSDLLSSLLDRLKDIDYEHNLLKGDKVIHSSMATLFLLYPQIKSVLLDSWEISCINLNKLQPGKESLVFFLNLANLMFLHAALMNSLLFKSENNCSGIFSKSCLESYLSLKHVGYIVGQLGFISLFDILFRILKQPIMNSTITACTILPMLKGELLDKECPNFFRCKLLEDILPDVPHELMFAVSQLAGHTPKINVFYPDTIEDELGRAISEYFNNIIIPQKSDMLKNSKISAILFAFLSSHPEGASKAIDTLKKYDNDDSIDLEWLRNFVHKKNLSNLKNLEDLQLGTGIRMEYLSDETNNHQSSSQLSLITDNRFSPKCTSKSSTSTKMNINLTNEIISFVNEKCPIVNIFLRKYLGLTDNSNLERDLFKTGCNSKFLDNMILLSSNDKEDSFFHDPNFSSIIYNVEYLLSRIPLKKIHDKYSKIDKNLVSLFNYLSKLPSNKYTENMELNYIWDQVLSSILSYKFEDLENPCYFFFLIKDVSLKFNVLKSFHSNWPVDATISCLYFLKADKTLSGLQKEWVLHKLHQMDIYSELLRVTETNMKKKIFLLDGEKVLEYLKEQRQYALLVRYAECHKLTDKCYALTILSSLLDYLDKIEPDFSKVKQLIEELPYEVLNNIIPDLLGKIMVHGTRSFLIDLYLKRTLSVKCASKLNSNIFVNDKVFVLQQELIGLTLVEDVAPKSFNRTQLFPLINFPNLILEQWIMNMKFDSVGIGIAKISPLLDAISVVDGTNEFLSWDQYHKIIEKYALKALEMSGIQVNAKKQKLKMNEIQQQFVIPLNAPSKFEWQPNSAVNLCPLCETAFSLFCRRHHCRRCGRVACAACSMIRFKVEGYNAPVRVCNHCFNSLCPKPTREISVTKPSSFENSITTDSSLDSSDHSEIGWFFTSDPDHIISVREEFSYDCAPSLSLCLAILSLHKDDSRAAISILKLIHKLFIFVIDVITAEFSEVDINFVLQMILTLVSSAKLRFGNIANYDGISLCEYYNQWVDVMELLINSKSINLLPSGCLSNMLCTGELQQRQMSGFFVESIRIQQNLEQERKYLKILRDNLVKNEKWQQALNLSTKAGFETTGVWGALAIASLKAGDFAAAREHFSKVLVKRMDKNKTLKSSLLNDIISYLECQPQLFKIQNTVDANSSSISNSDALIVTQTLNNLNLIVNGVLNGDEIEPLCSILPVKRSLDSLLQRECEYYITLYGCHRMYLQFLLRHKRTYDAVRYSMQMEIQGDTFAEEVLMPAFRKGQLTILWKVIKEVDPREKWCPDILDSSCQWLEKHEFIHCLLEIKKGLNDKLGSANIFLQLYTQSADSYSELMNRKHYLAEAILNFQAYLDYLPLNESTVKHHSKRGLSGLRKHSSSWSVNKYIHLCNFLDDVVRYLSIVESKDVTFRQFILDVQRIITEERTPKQTIVSSRIPSVFDKKELLASCIITVCGGGDIAKGLSLVYRVVETTDMNPKKLLSVSLKVLTSLGNHNDMPALIKGILEWGLFPESHVKSILWPSIIWAGKHAPESTMHNLVKFISNTTDKMNAFIEAGLLKLAYFQIVKYGSKNDCEKLLAAATSNGDQAIIFNCQKWLQNYANKNAK